MKRFAILLVILITGMSGTLLAQQAPAQCMPRPALVHQLSNVHKETPQSFGIHKNGNAVETFASEAGSWTIIITLPNGLSCIAAHGGSFEAITSSSGGDL